MPERRADRAVSSAAEPAAPVAEPVASAAAAAATSRSRALEPASQHGWRHRLFAVIFESDTRAGRTFDLVLIVAIVASVAVVVMDSIESMRVRHHQVLTTLEWLFTALFTVEYIARLACVKRPLRYATSVFGIIDLLSVLPTWLAILVPEVHLLIDVRILRLLRLFRILKLTAYVEEIRLLGGALAASRRKILVFMFFVLLVVLVMGTLMYVVEGPANGFTSIPVGVYWAITTMTTVGFGDIAPKTGIGRVIASVMMLLGWGTLAVPTGIVSAEFTARRMAPRHAARICPRCRADGHAPIARFCWNCGAGLPDEPV